MIEHFSGKTHKEKEIFHSWSSAKIHCDKFNSRKENIGKPKMTFYRCQICEEIHVRIDRTKKITFQVQDSSKKRIENVFAKSILIKKITL